MTKEENEIKAIICDRIFYDGKLQSGTLIYSITNGIIIKVASQSEPLPENLTHLEKLPNSSLIIPGIIDPHVHLNEPGRTEWEGFYTGTKAAVSGGVTTVVDMPLNAIPPTTTVVNMNTKLQAMRCKNNNSNKLFADICLWGGLVPDNISDLKPLVKRGVKGFKGFLIDSGVDEFPKIDAKNIDAIFDELLNEDTVVMFHAEFDNGCCTNEGDPSKYSTFLNSRPDSFEVDALQIVIDCMLACKQRNGKSPRVHIVHLSSSECIQLIKQAKTQHQLPITCETCFHYLALASENIPDGKTIFKCCPPIRSNKNREAIWKGLFDGVISTVVSDHSPCTPDLKNLGKGDFMDCWGGVCSVGLGLYLLYSTMKKEHSTMSSNKLWSHIVTWLCENTSKQVGLEQKKGFIKEGFNADFVIIDDSQHFKIDNNTTYFKNKLTPYEGFKSECKVMRTVLRGINVYSEAEGHIETPIGKCILD
ncbi:hypothetical protein QEN19_003648 [Hanseniaspora menglaensis]